MITMKQYTERVERIGTLTEVEVQECIEVNVELMSEALYSWVDGDSNAEPEDMLVDLRGLKEVRHKLFDKRDELGGEIRMKDLCVVVLKKEIEVLEETLRDSQNQEDKRLVQEIIDDVVRILEESKDGMSGELLALVYSYVIECTEYVWMEDPKMEEIMSIMRERYEVETSEEELRQFIELISKN